MTDSGNFADMVQACVNPSVLGRDVPLDGPHGTPPNWYKGYPFAGRLDESIYSQCLGNLIFTDKFGGEDYFRFRTEDAKRELKGLLGFTDP